MKTAAALAFRCNGTTVILDKRAFAKREVRIVEGFNSEQCEDCGSDIAETGEVTASGQVKCSCGSTYNVFSTTVEG
jgi:hypothetical protein